MNTLLSSIGWPVSYRSYLKWWRGIVWTLCILIFALLSAGCSDALSYSNQMIGMEIEYPSNWILTEDSETGISIRSTENSSVSITIQQLSKTNEQQSASEFLQEVLESNDSSQNFVFGDQIQLTSVDNSEAARVTGIHEAVTLRGSSYEVPIEVLVVNQRDDVLVFFVSNPSRATERILNSVSLTS